MPAMSVITNHDAFYRLLATVPAAELKKAQELLDKVQAALAEPSGPPDYTNDKAAQALEQLVPSR